MSKSHLWLPLIPVLLAAGCQSQTQILDSEQGIAVQTAVAAGSSKVVSLPELQSYFGLNSQAQLQTMMLLQLVGGGQLLLFVTRTERWFFLPPSPAAPLFLAILGTQIAAALMCGYGWLVPAIPWHLIGWIWMYLAGWLVVLGGIRLISERFVSLRTARAAKSIKLMNEPLQAHVPTAPRKRRMTFSGARISGPLPGVRWSSSTARTTRMSSSCARTSWCPRRSGRRATS